MERIVGTNDGSPQEQSPQSRHRCDGKILLFLCLRQQCISFCTCDKSKAIPMDGMTMWSLHSFWFIVVDSTVSFQNFLFVLHAGIFIFGSLCQGCHHVSALLVFFPLSSITIHNSLQSFHVTRQRQTHSFFGTRCHRKQSLQLSVTCHLSGPAIGTLATWQNPDYDP